MLRLEQRAYLSSKCHASKFCHEDRIDMINFCLYIAFQVLIWIQEEDPRPAALALLAVLSSVLEASD
jgi:hypothetical protein